MTDTERRVRRVAAVLVSLRFDGGAESLMRTLITELDGYPYDIEVFTLRAPDATRVGDFEARGVFVHTFPARRLVDPMRFVRFLRAIRSGGFDVLHTNLPAANVLGLLCGRMLRIPVVVVLHNSETSADAHWYHGRLERCLIHRFASRVIAVGERTARSRQEVLPGMTIEVLPNAVAPSAPLTPDERLALRASVMANPDRRLLLTVGRLTEQKAHGDLIDAFRLVRSRRDDVELLIAGRGDLEDELRRSVADLDLADVVHVPGMRHDVRSLMRAADAFVMSSRWEGLPVALLEAMEAGLPVASTDVGDIPEVLRRGAGVLVPPGAPDELARAIDDVLELPSGAGEANRRIVEERYSSHAWAMTMAHHYEGAIADGHARRSGWITRRRPRRPGWM